MAGRKFPRRNLLGRKLKTLTLARLAVPLTSGTPAEGEHPDYLCRGQKGSQQAGWGPAVTYPLLLPR